MQFRNLTSNASGSNASSYQTASVSPTPGATIIVAVETDIGAGAPATPSLSGLSLGWFVIEDCYYDQTGTTYRLTVFMSSPLSQASISGAITIDYDGVAQGGCSWIVDEALAADASRGFVRQSAKSAEPGSGATSVSIGVPEEGIEGSAMWACASWVAEESGTVSSGWEVLGQASHAAPSAAIISAFKSTLQESVTFSWTTSAPKGAIILEVYGVVQIELHTVQDDWKLRADADTPRSSGQNFSFDYYLTDTAGNYLTDTAGNRLVGRSYSFLYPQILHAIQDDFNLNSE